jgi:hypothetical protein
MKPLTVMLDDTVFDQLHNMSKKSGISKKRLISDALDDLIGSVDQMRPIINPDLSDGTNQELQ